jgi:hypothetical protein
MAAPRRYFGTVCVAFNAPAGGLVYQMHRTTVEGPKGTFTEELLDVLIESAKDEYDTDDLIVLSWTIHPEIM